MNTTQTQVIPSSSQLLKATATAACLAMVLLVSVILPAEYGVDPLGTGKALGLTKLRAPVATKPTETASPEGSSTLIQRAKPYRSDEVSMSLKPGEGAEIKATMQTSDRFVYSWIAEGGAVDFDMHGEEFNAPAGDYTSYSKKKQQSGDNGAFVAPFHGLHGWYWHNKGSQSVTIRLKTSGFYEKVAKQ
jgi:hypothetical protein